MLLVVAVLVSACATVSLPDGFEPVSPPASGMAVELLEVVLERDARPLQGRSKVGIGMITFIPLVPYAPQKLSPELAGPQNAIKTQDFPHDVAKTVIKDLRTARVAGWVGAPNDRLPGPGSDRPAYRLRLTVEEGIYHRNVTLYGVSFLGLFFWIAGLPISYGSAELIFAVELMDPWGKLLGRKRFDSRVGCVEWLYYSLGPAYNGAMSKSYAQISPRLREFVSSSLRSAKDAN